MAGFNLSGALRGLGAGLSVLGEAGMKSKLDEEARKAQLELQARIAEQASVNDDARATARMVREDELTTGRLGVADELERERMRLGNQLDIEKATNPGVLSAAAQLEKGKARGQVEGQIEAYGGIDNMITATTRGRVTVDEDGNPITTGRGGKGGAAGGAKIVEVPDPDDPEQLRKIPMVQFTTPDGYTDFMDLKEYQAAVAEMRARGGVGSDAAPTPENPTPAKADTPTPTTGGVLSQAAAAGGSADRKVLEQQLRDVEAQIEAIANGARASTDKKERELLSQQITKLVSKKQDLLAALKK